ncbi:hypothetical protein ACU18_02155 [Arthrobacter sp. ZBG10]|nr:hypothetical protein ACU18_02155 [Arthrobacter sp. ZBG10]
MVQAHEYVSVAVAGTKSAPQEASVIRMVAYSGWCSAPGPGLWRRRTRAPIEGVSITAEASVMISGAHVRQPTSSSA